MDDCLLQQTPILEVSPANVPDSVIAQCKLNCETDDNNTKVSEERETDAFLDETYKKSITQELILFIQKGASTSSTNMSEAQETNEVVADNNGGRDLAQLFSDAEVAEGKTI